MERQHHLDAETATTPKEETSSTAEDNDNFDQEIPTLLDTVSSRTIPEFDEKEIILPTLEELDATGREMDSGSIDLSVLTRNLVPHHEIPEEDGSIQNVNTLILQLSKALSKHKD